jgi:hypothetical protein
MDTYLIIGIAVVVVAVVALLVFKKKPTLLDSIKKAFKKEWKIEYETVSIEDCLNFLEVVNWFKTLKLDKNKHVPFVAKASAMKDKLSIQPTKKESLFIGVYDEEKDEIVHAKFIETDELDAKTREVLGNEDLIVLS